MNPQEPIVPIPEVPKVEDPERVVNEVKPRVERDSHWISILAMAIFIVLSLGVVAFLYYQNQVLKSMLAASQTPLSSPEPSAQAATATADPTVNWKTYTDTVNYFSLQYPGSYFTYLDNPSVGFTAYTSAPVGGNGPKFLPNKTDAWLTSVVTKTTNNQTISQYVAAQKSYQNAIKTPILMAGLDAYKVTYQGQTFCAGNTCTPYYSYDGVVLKNGYIYTVTLTSLNQNTINNDSTLFDQILSTFKFIGATPTPVSSAIPTPVSVPSAVPGGF